MSDHEKQGANRMSDGHTEACLCGFCQWLRRPSVADSKIALTIDGDTQVFPNRAALERYVSGIADSEDLVQKEQETLHNEYWYFFLNLLGEQGATAARRDFVRARISAIIRAEARKVW